MKYLLILTLLLAGCGSRPIATARMTPLQVCATTGTECARYLLNRINHHRAALGLPRYSLDWTLSHNNGECQGATSHAQAMRTTGSIWHTNPAYPANSFPTDFCASWTSAGQNVGEASGDNEAQAIATIDNMMLAEGPSGGHWQNLMSHTYTHVGFGFARNGSTTYLVEDFIAN